MSIDEPRQRSEQPPPSRRRGALAATRSGHQENERSFFCRICQRSERGIWVPAGWYLLERAPGGRGRHLRLGLYCSVTCLIQAGQMLEEGAAAHAQRMSLPSEEDRRRERQRVVDVAQTLLSDGMSVRQAADSLKVPTFTLRTWLKEAGIRIDQAAAAQEAARIAVATTAVSAGEPLTVEHHPISVLNEQEQQGRISPLEWQVTSTGPSHAPAFTATVSTRIITDDRSVSATGTGASKAAARAAAAAALLSELTAS
ncbi:putative dsRNA-binding protein [Planomonospora parontospora]|uniref:putative dsRNA-binding protein n=1 Tax=Planomonospora parontospora TaxID=58119 RepID=UPI00166FFB59|nr:putative dsRNA-binding protein [Planomonospora parontospora]GGL50109.1 hypothetical protein GCM10014719_59200 [Planomonospora parontospora subsp. antibiotica]GII19262.1 hypothetical protein Ppa05_59880 [Planomonospora parontospora subsp. antibiotica]